MKKSAGWIAAALLLAFGCDNTERRALDLEAVRVAPNAKLRTDTVDDGAFAKTATFVLVDAENAGDDGAYVTLAGQLGDAQGRAVGQLKPQSLWLPARGSRTFALVDQERQQRPTATTARIVVRSGTIPKRPPVVHVEQIREIGDHGKLVVQGVVHNDADRTGQIMVIASFHSVDGQPLTRPFSVLTIPGHGVQPVQFVSKPGAAHGTIYVGDTSF